MSSATTVTKIKTDTSDKKPSEHPSYEKMITEAITSLKERNGSSRIAVKKYILANYKVTPGAHFDTQVLGAIKRGVAKNVFSLPKGVSGTIKLVKSEKKPSEKKATDKKVTEKKQVKKPAATKKKASPVKKGVALKQADNATKTKPTAPISKKVTKSRVEAMTKKPATAKNNPA